MDEPAGRAIPAGLVRVELGKGCLLVLPESVYLAGLRLGKILQRRETLAKRVSSPGPERDRGT